MSRFWTYWRIWHKTRFQVDVRICNIDWLHDFSYITGTASSKPCFWCITVKYGHKYDHHFWNSSCDECKCQLKKTISKICLSMTASTNIIIYFFTKIKTVGGRSLKKKRTIFISKQSFAFSYISRIQVSVTFLKQVRLL